MSIGHMFQDASEPLQSLHHYLFRGVTGEVYLFVAPKGISGGSIRQVT